MFLSFKKAVQNQLRHLIDKSDDLYQVELDKDEFYQLYLDSYPEGTNPIYRERTLHDCSACRRFIKQYGTIVGIIDNKTVSIWDIDTSGLDDEYTTVAEAMSAKILSLPIANKFLSKEKNLGVDHNFEEIEGKVHKWEHFYYKIPKQFVNTSSDSIDTQLSQHRQTQEVIYRSLNEITVDAVDTVLELISTKALYRGDEHKSKLDKFKKAQSQFNKLKSDSSKINFAWSLSGSAGRSLAIRNTAIGTLLVDLSEGLDIETAVAKYEKVVAPANYKRPKAIFTKKMREEAEAKAKELGIIESFGRRYATLSDLNIQNVLWASGNSKKVMSSPFDIISNDDVVKPKKFSHIEEMGIEAFIKDVLPQATELELMVENSHKNNFVSLIAPTNPDAPSMFSWNNPFSWSYAGEFTDSIKESVKSRGGNTTGVLRFSISWAEDNTSDNSDLDAHCITPKGERIHFGFMRGSCGGHLDVDIRYPRQRGHKDIVENIAWGSTNQMAKGDYQFMVHNFNLSGNQQGFKAQIELDNGDIFDFVYPHPLRQDETVVVATVNYDGKKFTLNEKLKSNKSSQEFWGVPTMKFNPVSTVLTSPNHWDDNNIGNKHYFFMIPDCVNDSDTRGFYNEFLKPELLQHKRVFEALGSKMRVPFDKHQLSGLGFSSTMKNSIVLKINSKPIKINFTDEKLVSKSTTKKVSI